MIDIRTEDFLDTLDDALAFPAPPGSVGPTAPADSTDPDRRSELMKLIELRTTGVREVIRRLRAGDLDMDDAVSSLERLSERRLARSRPEPRMTRFCDIRELPTPEALRDWAHAHGTPVRLLGRDVHGREVYGATRGPTTRVARGPATEPPGRTPGWRSPLERAPEDPRDTADRVLDELVVGRWVLSIEGEPTAQEYVAYRPVGWVGEGNPHERLRAPTREALIDALAARAHQSRRPASD
ncbi:hypothetical protein GCM10007079_09690 [Nocardiopsis terrae]|uniref:Uncharacterized protein n=1 Tax=Nocardiopsis terrae TaxID=372655 RepID=A0ABR9HCS7_9ACTN|nr:hypothetical protein [Nocardiopsis terrae]MBE1456816.1 hypothetical protein [Nocardiopsis terrae]GHC74972.1 hypothetical protein GCM10007079_09690 [Nocardiopsis terrae]